MATAGDSQALTLRVVTMIMVTVVSLTFVFGFGNVLALALRLGVPGWVAPLVAHAVDLSVVGLLVGTRHLALRGATRDQLRPARRLLMFATGMTLALNTASPLLSDRWGEAAFDAVGPLLLFGWSEVGPDLLQAIAGSSAASDDPAATAELASPGRALAQTTDRQAEINGEPLDRARCEDILHWDTLQRPISAETLRKRLHVGAVRSRALVSAVRAETTQERARFKRLLVCRFLR